MQTQKTSSRGSASSSTNARAAADSIFDLLIADHRAVAGVFEQLKSQLEKDEADSARCLDLLAKVDALLTPHARAEEELIYPAFSTGDEARNAVAEGFEEHALIHQLCGELKKLAEVDGIWRAKAKVLVDLVEHHVREEENEMIPQARKVLDSEESAALASEFLAGKERIGVELGLPPPESLELPPPARSRPAKA